MHKRIHSYDITEYIAMGLSVHRLIKYFYNGQIVNKFITSTLAIAGCHISRGDDWKNT